jgi:hypothetical protein
VGVKADVVCFLLPIRPLEAEHAVTNIAKPNEIKNFNAKANIEKYRCFAIFI